MVPFLPVRPVARIFGVVFAVPGDFQYRGDLLSYLFAALFTRQRCRRNGPWRSKHFLLQGLLMDRLGIRNGLPKLLIASLACRMHILYLFLSPALKTRLRSVNNRRVLIAYICRRRSPGSVNVNKPTPRHPPVIYSISLPRATTHVPWAPHVQQHCIALLIRIIDEQRDIPLLGQLYDARTNLVIDLMNKQCGPSARCGMNKLELR